MGSSLKKLYDEKGYIIIPGLITEADRVELQAACDRVVAKTRNGSWKYRRTVGKQFPPYGDDDPDSWGVQHVMHPMLEEPIFARWYSSSALIEKVKELLNCEEDDLQMELFNLLINPLNHNFALCWHRDDVSGTATEEEEREALSVWHHGIQWNTALFMDCCLYVVPGSHITPRTLEQRKHSEGHTPPVNPLDMPGAIQVTLHPGDTVFYNSNILHCATYDSTHKRATLHACIGNIKGGDSRARNVLQHGLDWMKSEQFRDTLPDEKSKAMLNRLLRMHSNSLNVGYSLSG